MDRLEHDVATEIRTQLLRSNECQLCCERCGVKLMVPWTMVPRRDGMAEHLCRSCGRSQKEGAISGFPQCDRILHLVPVNNYTNYFVPT